MKRTILIAAVCVLGPLSCAGEGEYDNSDLQLAPSYGAKELCSCLFVLEQPEDFCKAWTKASPAVVTTRIDRAERRVYAAAILFWSARARFVDARTGCVLE